VGFQWRSVSSPVWWEKAITAFFDGIRLRSIQNKILVFALLATLIPSVTMGWLSYKNNRQVLDEKIAQEVTNLASHASRELKLWVKEHRYDGKVFSSSYEVSENLEKLGDPGTPDRTGTRALKRIKDYLESIDEKFTEYEELVVTGVDGNVVTSSADRPGTLDLPEDWLQRARANQGTIGNAHWDETLQRRVMVFVEPIRNTENVFLGTLGIKVNLEAMDEILAGYLTDPSHGLCVVTRRGQILAGSGVSTTEKPKVDIATVRKLFAREMVPVEFVDAHGREVVGALRQVPGMEWGVVAHKDRTQAYAAIAKLRSYTLILIFTVLLAIGVAAYLICLTIVRPLNRLTRGSTEVADGNLELRLPVYGRSDVGTMTEVFNDMVARLRKFHDENVAITEELRRRNVELHEISITDGLTGLYNRTYMPETLAKELARAKRHERSFSILMIDIDHFKRFNDTHGHQAGDDVLLGVAQILKSSVRACDYASRYGGEEFLVLLTETEGAGAAEFAEKLRLQVEAMSTVAREPVTVSIGVASFPDNGDDLESIIRDADAALYRCKRDGRNQVRLAEGGTRELEPVSG
jgi:diguanylate cyclase (GGDEF)-like protein